MKPSEKTKWIFVKIISIFFKFLFKKTSLFIFYFTIYATVFFASYDLSEMSKSFILYKIVFFILLFELFYYIFLKKVSKELIKGFSHHLEESKKHL